MSCRLFSWALRPCVVDIYKNNSKPIQLASDAVEISEFQLNLQVLSGAVLQATHTRVPGSSFVVLGGVHCAFRASTS